MSIPVSRQHSRSFAIVIELEYDAGRGQAGQHLAPFKCRHKIALAREDLVPIRSHVVGVRPDAKLWVVIELLGVDQERIAIVLACGVRGLRDSETLIPVQRRNVILAGEAAYKPTLRIVVVLHDHVAPTSAAGSGKPVPELSPGKRAEEQITGLVINGSRKVHRLKVMIRARGAGRICRKRRAHETGRRRYAGKTPDQGQTRSRIERDRTVGCLEYLFRLPGRGSDKVP